MTPSAGGGEVVLTVDLPEPLAVAGPWNVSFQAGRGAPAQAIFEKLISWPDHSEAGIRYFSGTATYRRNLDIPAELLVPGRELHLDLGRVQVIAEVTNLWPNRLIGDEQLPEDIDWAGLPLKRWPAWLLNGTSRPVPQRVTFTTWHHWRKDSPLLPSGLLGPVMLRPLAVVPVSATEK
jgi:hypothetical protein